MDPALSRACTSRPTLDRVAKELLPWKCNRAVYLSLFKESPATLIPANPSASSPVPHTTHRLLTDFPTETPVAHGGEEAEPRKVVRAVREATATSSAIWKIALLRKVSWDRANGIDTQCLTNTQPLTGIAIDVLSTCSPGYLPIYLHVSKCYQIGRVHMYCSS